MGINNNILSEIREFHFVNFNQGILTCPRKKN